MSLTCPTCRTNFPDGTAECPHDGSVLLAGEAFVNADADVEPGTMIGEYRVEKKLGAGSFGAVYAGLQPLIGKRVAIKLLHKRMSSEPDIVARFIDEARAVNRIGHRNIIDVFSFGVHAGSQHYFVMEFCDGLTLGQLVQEKKRLDISEALPIFRAIASALDAAHEAAVTHRDLKPDNVFLARERNGEFTPKLLDFGVAKLVREEGAAKTATGIAIGTPRYMSPEQCRGKKVDHRTDIYALGCVIHEVLTGQPVFDADSTVDLLFKHTSEEPPTMSSVCPAVPAELDAPILAMLAKKPAKRPNSAGSAIAALEEAAHRSTKATPSPQPTLAETAETTRATDETLPAHNTESTELHYGRTEIAPAAPAPPEALQTLASSPLTLDVHEKPVPTVAVARTNTTKMSVAATLPIESTKPGRSISTILPGLGIVAVLVAFGIFALRKGDDKPAAPLPAPNESAHVLTPERSTVSLRVAVMPADARIVVDGRDLGGAGDAIVLPREKKQHAVRIERQGYESQTMWISADEDKEIGPISLQAIIVSPAASSSTDKPINPGPKPSSTKQRLNKDLWRPDEFGRQK